jgi:hypothetical protein
MSNYLLPTIYQRKFNLTNGDGDVNKFEVADGAADSTFASFSFLSELTSEGFATLEVFANCEDGFEVSQSNKLQANTQFAGALSASGQSVGVDGSGYSVSHPSAFRTEIGAIDSADLQAALEDYYTASATDALLAAKQATLVSATNIKTINGSSLLGPGDLTVSGGSSLTVTEVDGTPSMTATTLRVPNGSLTNEGSGVAALEFLDATKLPLTGGTLTGILNITQGTANTSYLNLSGYSVTGTSSVDAIDITGTFNTTGTPTFFDINVLDTASNAASLLFNLRLNSANRFKVFKSGLVEINVPSGHSARCFDVLRNGVTAFAIESTGSCVSNVNFTCGNVQIGSNYLYNSNCWFYADAANTWAARNGTNAQEFRINNTYTSGTNYEAWAVDWRTTANRCIVGPKIGSSGTLRQQVFTGLSSTAADPTTSELAAGQWGVHRNSSTGAVFVAYNDGGTIKKVQLT